MRSKVVIALASLQFVSLFLSEPWPFWNFRQPEKDKFRVYGIVEKGVEQDIPFEAFQPLWHPQHLANNHGIDYYKLYKLNGEPHGSFVAIGIENLDAE